MSNIGNDNYKKAMTSASVRTRGGWLSSNIAQLMVFVNGLILTVTAFATLSVFIDEIVQEGFRQTVDQVEQHIIRNYAETERSLNALSTIIATPEQVSISDLGDYIRKDSSGAYLFDQIYWIQNTDVEAWNAISLKDGKNYIDLFGSNQNFINFVRRNARRADPTKGDDLHLVTDFPNQETWVTNDVGNNLDHTFMLVKSQNAGSVENGYIVGLSRFNNVVQTEWLDSKINIYDLQIMDTAFNAPIYRYEKNAENKSNDFIQSINFSPQNFSSLPIEIIVSLSVNPREAFLQKIPLLMLLFGITLTLIGTLYVRNNQTQSKKLAAMNKELAHKNFELNQEVSERERLNDVIQKSARENRAVVNSVSDIIFEVSVEGVLLFLNEAWNKVTGFELERSIGRNLIDLIYTHDQEEQRQNLAALAKGQKKSYRAFTRLRSADGTFRAVEIAVSMLRQDENKDLRVVGTITDVEERRRAERALSEAEKKYRAIVENAAGGIYQVTPEGQFLSANPAFAKITGYDNPENLLRDIENAHSQLYIDSENRERFLASISDAVEAVNFESQIKKKDGSIIWTNENVRSVRDDEGNLLFYEGSIEDVDQRRKAENALKEAMIQSDLSSRSKSEFLANMSHELRTPLNSVIGFSEIIKNEAFGKIVQPEYTEYAADIHESGNKLLKVINEILDVSRIEAGERALNETIIDVSKTAKSCIDLMETKIKSGKMRIENKIKNSDLRFIGEEQAVKQMLINLISNSIKFSAANSMIMLDADLDNKGRLCLSVTDTGMGMNEAELEKALSPFGQVDSEHKRAKSGTGLGLTLVKSLIELHGGGLDIVSQKGIGTTATLIFPAKRVANKQEKTEENTNQENTSQAEEETSS